MFYNYQLFECCHAHKLISWSADDGIFNMCGQMLSYTILSVIRCMHSKIIVDNCTFFIDLAIRPKIRVDLILLSISYFICANIYCFQAIFKIFHIDYKAHSSVLMHVAVVYGSNISLFH